MQGEHGRWVYAGAPVGAPSFCSGLTLTKCAIRHDLLSREPAPSSIVEADDQKLDVELDNSGEPKEESEVEAFSWDELLIEEEDEESMSCSN
jgi:hypothetical protein